MIVAPFIRILRSKEQAFFFKNSPQNTQFIFKGVHLLPNNTAKYIQVTDTPNGLNLEDWTVNAVDLCSGEKTNITNYFLVESLTNDEYGAPQFYWSLKNVPFDFGYKLIYLEIEQAIGELFYSTPFLLTEINSEKTSQFHYREEKTEPFQSIGLQAYFLDNDKKTELTTYYQVSTKNTVSKAVKTSLLQLFRTELMPRDILINLTYVLESPILYVNYVRNNLYKSIDIPERVSQENFASFDFSLSPNYKDSFFGQDYNGVDYGTDYNI